MKIIVLLFFLLTCLTAGSRSQSSVPTNPFGFVMDEPQNWSPSNKEEIETSLKRFDLRNDELEKFLSQNQGKHLLFAYVKFKQDSFSGINPKIEGRVGRITSPKPPSFAEFRPAAIATLKRIAGQFDEQHYIVEPSDIKIGGVDSVYHVSEFTMKVQDGTRYRVRSRTYMIPRGTYFFQISFVDQPTVNDCSVVFDALLKSIKFLN